MERDPLAEIDRAIGALHDKTRRRILLDLYAHGTESTVDEVATAIGVHRTVAYGHLERLAALGFLATGQRRGTSGKPAKLYRLTDQAIDFSYPVRRFARLAALLAEGLQRRGEDGIELARETGKRYGMSLVRGRAASPQAVLDQLAPLGADYTVRGDEILAGNCIFRQACDVAEAVVCELHAGLLEGAFESAGLDVRTEAYRNYAERGCAYRLLTK